MATLHTINKSPFERNSLESCLRFATEGAGIVLIEDAVVGALAGTRMTAQLADAMNRISVYVLGPDMDARGLRDKPTIDGVQVVDYDGFVDLTSEYDRVQAWL